MIETCTDSNCCEAKRRILELQNMQWVRKNAIGQVSPGLQSPCSAASLICHSSFICHSSNLSASLRLMTENMKRGVGSCCNKRRKPKPAVAKSEAVAAGSCCKKRRKKRMREKGKREKEKKRHRSLKSV